MMKKRILLLNSLALISLALWFGSCRQSVSEETAYVFTSFREPSTQGMQYLYSLDGLHWDTLPGIWLAPKVGNDTTYVNAWTGEVQAPKYYPDERVMRDPSIVRGPDGTFHLVWTTQWMGSRGFGYASSPDLIHWSEQRVIDVMADIPTNNVWAPELFYDEEQRQFLIIWSSQIDPKDYTAADTLGTNGCHRMWYTTTRDFQTFSPAQRYYDPGFNSIDGYLLKRGAKDYVLVVKDNRKPGFSNLFCVFSDSPYGPFHTFDNVPIGTTPTTTFGRTYSEGPCAIPLGDEWIIYFDQYHPQEYGAVSTRDFLTFTPIPERISVPANHKHGTIVEVSRKQLDALLEYAKTH